MTLYKKWMQIAYDQTGSSNIKTWNLFYPQERKIYETLIGNKTNEISGKLADLASEHGMSDEFFCGFLDGISGALNEEIEISELESDSDISFSFEFENLYKKMVEYKAKPLYSLDEWGGIFSDEQRERFAREQRESKTVRAEDKPGRNDPCHCGSGKKYKKCCA
ncbi:MAG: SEC-C metal-binding domain-containing protein [Defluviitaleaceae bacterium]|nr:SEC-C metal-binding domain-containing protein [Defluviitaleaceae bacterium]